MTIELTKTVTRGFKMAIADSLLGAGANLWGYI